MFICYVDESGDIGLVNSPTRYFVLTALVMHELRWKEYLDQLIDLRKRLRQAYGLKLREEIHAAPMITKPGQLTRIPKHERLFILRAIAKELATMQDLNVISIVIDKQTKAATYDVFESAWNALVTRIETTMSNRNFRGPANPDERVMLLPDRTDDKKLARLVRRMRYYNPIPNQPAFGPGFRNITVRYLIEDPLLKDSADSYFIQATDVAAYWIYQKYAPNKYIRKKGAQNTYQLFSSVMCTVISSSGDGIKVL